jgi:hypothetical protein
VENLSDQRTTRQASGDDRVVDGLLRDADRVSARVGFTSVTGHTIAKVRLARPGAGISFNADETI